jgi:hypothetical protein
MNLSVSDAAQRLRLVEVRYLAELPPRHGLIEPLAGKGAQGRMADGRGRGAAGGGGGGWGDGRRRRRDRSCSVVEP